MASQTRNSSRASSAEHKALSDARDRIDAAADRAAEALGRAGEELPAVVEGANRLAAATAEGLSQSPDEALRIGAAAGTGFVLGLYLAGAPRLLVTLAVLPVIAMGITLASRPARTSRAG